MSNTEIIDLTLSNSEFENLYSRKKIVSFMTLGCKVNQYETEAMEELFKKDGYEVGTFEEFADVYVINTCTVTSMSDKKSRQIIRRAKKKNPNAIVAVVGCYSQASPDEVLGIEGVNLVMGTKDRSDIVNQINKLSQDQKASFVEDIMKVREFEELGIEETTGKTRAFIKIQEGCDRFCSYCIIPYTRGPVRSRKLENIIAEVKLLGEKGFKEVVLTGIHVASYGKDLKDTNLIDVLTAIEELDVIERVRLSSVEPLMMTEEFVAKLKGLKKICPHFHLSLQSGCDETLKRMNRRYDTSIYRTIAKRLRENFKDVSLTTDVIVGFPGETEEEFESTRKFLEEINLYQMHIFKYSIREGTPAATMENQVNPEIKNKRSDILFEIDKKNRLEFEEKFVGRQMDVLFEKALEDGIYEGLTKNYMRILVNSTEDLEGQIRVVEIKKINEDHLEGILL